MSITTMLPILQFMLTFGNLCIMLYAFKTFLSKPHDTLEERVDKLEDDIKDIKSQMTIGLGRCDENRDTLTVVINSLLALIEFEMEYCITEHKNPSTGLIDAKKTLQTFLAKR